MPWLPELFSAPALAKIWEDERRRRLRLVPFYSGLLTEETGALVGSFAGEPELHHPILGRIKGVAAFERFVAEARDELAHHDATVEDVDFTLTPGCGVEELIVRGLGDDGRLELPMAVASDHDEEGLIVEQRMYFRTRLLVRGPVGRPPLLQADPGLHLPDVVADHGHELVGGRGSTLAPCAVTDDGHACALEYNVVRAGTRPEASLAVFVRGEGGRLAATRRYDDADPPLVVA